MSDPRVSWWIPVLTRLLPARYRADILDDLLEERAALLEHGWSPFAASLWLLGHTLRSAVAARRRPTTNFAAGANALHALLSAGRDARMALRAARLRPGFALLATGTMALGVASAVATFAVCDATLFRPLPYPDPDRVVFLGQVGYSVKGHGIAISPALINAPAFADVGVYETGGLNLGDAGTSDRLRAAAVSSGFFRVLETHALEGRTLSIDDDREASRVAILSFGLSRGRFGGNAALGTVIRLNGQAFTVVGTMPKGFDFPEQTDVWVPPYADGQISGLAYLPSVIARLAPGKTIADARDAVAHAPAAVGFGVGSGTQGGRLGMTAAPNPATVRVLQESLTLGSKPTLLFVTGMAALLLAVTAANLAGLMLGRLHRRQREMIVRAALGASRMRLAAQLAIEALALTAAGGGAGIALAIAGLHILPATAAGLVPGSVSGRASGTALALDARFSALCLLTTMATAVLFAVVPVLVGSRTPASTVSGGVTGLPRARSIGPSVVVAQLAITLMLVIGTSAASAVLVALNRVDLGFHNDHAVVFELTLPSARYPDIAAVSRLATVLTERLRHLPNVVDAGATAAAPGSTAPALGVQLSNGSPATAPRLASMLFAGPGYFRSMGIAVRGGRDFTEDDRTRDTVIVSASLARMLWGDASRAVGQRVSSVAPFGPRPLQAQIVGVVDDVRLTGPGTAGTPQFYLPLDQQLFFGVLDLVVATRGNPEEALAAIRANVHDVDADLAMYNIVPVRDLQARFLTNQRLTAGVSSALAILALVLSAVGLFGVMSQTVTERTRDVGIRIALGADRRRIARDVLVGAIRLALAGLIVGFFASAIVVTAGRHALPGAAFPPATILVLDGLILIAVALLAAWIPAHRAATSDPIVALRQE